MKRLILILIAALAFPCLVAECYTLWMGHQFERTRAAQIADVKSDLAPLQRRLGKVLPGMKAAEWCAFNDKFSECYPIPDQDPMLRLCAIVHVEGAALLALLEGVDDLRPFVLPEEAG